MNNNKMSSILILISVYLQVALIMALEAIRRGWGWNLFDEKQRYMFDLNTKSKFKKSY